MKSRLSSNGWVGGVLTVGGLALPLALGGVGAGCSHTGAETREPVAAAPQALPATPSPSSAHVAALQRQVTAETRARCLAEEARRRAEANCKVGQSQTRVETIPSEVLFAFDDDQLMPSATDRLDRAASVLQQDPQARLEIVGHSDGVGESDYNQDLSERRARAVGQYLIDHGISPDRIQTEGRGANDPLVDNDTPEGRAINRRVDLRVQRGSTTF